MEKSFLITDASGGSEGFAGLAWLFYQPTNKKILVGGKYFRMKTFTPPKSFDIEVMSQIYGLNDVIQHPKIQTTHVICINDNKHSGLFCQKYTSQETKKKQKHSEIYNLYITALQSITTTGLTIEFQHFHKSMSTEIKFLHNLIHILANYYRRVCINEWSPEIQISKQKSQSHRDTLAYFRSTLLLFCQQRLIYWL